MTKGEFITDFDRLCRGFRVDSTPEQIDAWYRKVIPYDRHDWVDAVDTLLCGPRFPHLDPALAALEHAREHRKRTALHRDQRPAEQMAERVLTGHGCPLSKNLFACIKAFNGRQQVRTEIGLVMANFGNQYDPQEQEDLVKALRQREATLTAEYERLLTNLNQEDGDAFTVRYGKAVLA